MVRGFRTSLLTNLVLAGVAACVIAAAAQRPRASDNNPDVIEARHYTLTMAKIDQYVAAAQTLQKYADAHPELKDRMNLDESDHETLTQKAAEMDAKYPQVAVMLRGYGFSSREFLVMSMALVNDVMLVGMKKQGAIQAYPAGMITPENAALVEQNYDKISAGLNSVAPKDEDNK
jgi:hypothetical protein